MLAAILNLCFAQLNCAVRWWNVFITQLACVIGEDDAIRISDFLVVCQPQLGRLAGDLAMFVVLPAVVLAATGRSKAMLWRGVWFATGAVFATNFAIFNLSQMRPIDVHMAVRQSALTTIIMGVFMLAAEVLLRTGKLAWYTLRKLAKRRGNRTWALLGYAEAH